MRRKVKNFLTIIISTYNNEDSIRLTLESLASQSFDNFNVVIADKQSSDKTIQIVRKYFKRLRISVYSRKDNGIYDAWNYVLKKIDTNYVSFLGSGDQYYDDNSLNILISLVQKKPNFFYYHGKTTLGSKIHGRKWIWSEFKKYMTVAHPGMIMSMDYIKEKNFFSTNYLIASDYEIILKSKDKFKDCFVDTVISTMMPGGISSSSCRGIFEEFRIKRKYKVENFCRCSIHFFWALIKFLFRRLYVKY